MAMERNGVVFFDPAAKNDDHPTFKALKAVSLGDVWFPFGFFLIEGMGRGMCFQAQKTIFSRGRLSQAGARTLRKIWARLIGMYRIV